MRNGMVRAATPRKIRLLILDEDRVYARSLARALGGAGYEVHATDSPDGALAALHASGAELLLADVGPSASAAGEFLVDVRRAAPGTLVLVVTAFGSPGQAVAATRAGAFCYLTKPADADEVRSVVDMAARQYWLISESGAPRRRKTDVESAGPSGPSGPTDLEQDGGYNTGPLDQALAGSERQIILSALGRNAWNRQATAAQLGINRATLYKKMRKYALDRLPLKP